MDTLTVSIRRIRFLFKEFPRIVVSVSGGKDSTVLYDLCLQEAIRIGKRFELFFLDQEAEYQSTIDIIEGQMSHPMVIPRWFQIPLRLTNATSFRQVFMHAWGHGEEWMREKHPLAIHQIDEPYPDRFYEFFPWYEAKASVATAFLVGVRQWESLNRQRATKSNAGYQNFGWSTKTKNPIAYRFYPIYHWQPRYIWKYIADHGLPYNRVYDRMFVQSGENLMRMRVSNLIHEVSYKALRTLQEFEPDTFDKLDKRLKGVHAAAMYCEENAMYRADKLPKTFSTWRQYRDYLLDTTPIDNKDRFIARFNRQPDDEATCRQHVKQLLANDWENNLPVLRPKASRLRKVWWDRL